VLGVLVVGCGDKGGQVIYPENFYARPAPNPGPNAAAAPTGPADRSGPLYTQVGGGVDVMRRPGEGENSSPPVTSISKVVEESVQSPEVAATQNATTSSGTASAPRGASTRVASTRGKSTGEYITIGGVVAEVNGTPIYANKILKALDTALATKAKELDAKQFEHVASDLINKQVQEYVRAELEYAAADRNLQSDDKTLADNLTMQWRQKRITECGGSVEV